MKFDQKRHLSVFEELSVVHQKQEYLLNLHHRMTQRRVYLNRGEAFRKEFDRDEKHSWCFVLRMRMQCL